MLVLSRKKTQSIIIGDNIEITIIDIQGDQVRLGISAPRNITIHRKEVFLEIQEENKKAADSKPTDLYGLFKK
ncbi:carbon storage regulator CsrA [Petroclostridium sp. X23]|uniref:carbon storage regulator CsrA n=1 Tax=Petroclostridium sp. X23 TaxID=3045146 RepID=UPI0024AD3DB5|nr:carbon storage regulator CsrA [Petroclostridium sp. X23]WHH61515.1 carbon storage regulator CsrA [Petroclostridium sp. X23]